MTYFYLTVLVCASAYIGFIYLTKLRPSTKENDSETEETEDSDEFEITQPFMVAMALSMFGAAGMMLIKMHPVRCMFISCVIGLLGYSAIYLLKRAFAGNHLIFQDSTQREASSSEQETESEPEDIDIYKEPTVDLEYDEEYEGAETEE